MFKSKKKTIEEIRLFGLSLVSNCNNEATVFKKVKFERRKKSLFFNSGRKRVEYKPYTEYEIPSPPVPECNRFSKCKLMCSPLSSIGIQLGEDIPIYLGKGSFNLAYTIKNHFSEESKDKNHFSEESKDLVFRVTRPGLVRSKISGQILQEQIGLEYQTLLSKTRKEKGFECPYITKVYDFGIFEVIEPSIANEKIKTKKGYDSNEIGVYSIMEKVNGGELYDRILKHNYTLEESKRLMINLLNCLNCIHKKKIVHLDLKLENIVLVHDELSDNINKNTDIKLIDFGLSGEIGESTGIRGTPAYLPIGMIKDSLENKRHKITVADDIWSAGIILLNILTKKTSNKNYDRIHQINANTFYGLKPNNKTYEIIKEEFDLPQREWEKLQNFLEKIFGKVGIEYRKGIDGKTLIPITEQPIITAEELLKDEWLNSSYSENDFPGRLGGGKKTLRGRKTRKNTYKKNTHKNKRKNNKN